MRKCKVIVIGAGIGGLATAIQLAKRGFSVTVFEKNGYPGGRCQRIVRDGHVFDNGPTMYLFPHIYADFFASIGEDIRSYLMLRRVDPTYKLHFADDTSITLTSDLLKMRRQLEALEPGSYRRYLEYLEDAENQYRIAMGRMVHRSLTHPWEYFNLKNLYLFLRYRSLSRHYAHACRYFRHPNLAAAFTFQDSYLSLNPFSAPAICSLFAYSEHAEGSYLPEGGMHQVISALETIARKSGVTMRFNSPVGNITVRNNRAVGVLLEDGSVATADFVVVNTGMGYAYQQLLPGNAHARKLLRRKYSSSAIIFHWGTDKTYPQLMTHNLFFTEPYRDGFDHVIERPEPPKETHFYIQAPARTDPTRAPKGRDTLSVMIPINHMYPEYPVDWEILKDRMRDAVITRLARAGLRGIGRHIRFEISCGPPDWQSRLNLTYGAIYGLHHNFGQLGYLRPSREHAKYRNIFFVGADTHPGSGLPTVLLSSRFTASRILNRLGYVR